MKTHPSRGSHLPVLMKLVSITTGPILELGCGMYSTAYLHWSCFSANRRLLTCESKPEWMDFLNQFNTDFHEVRFVEDWDKLDLSEPWSIAFVDHDPDSHRAIEMKRLTHADYVVAHDSENKTDRRRTNRFTDLNRLYKYHWKYNVTSPHTSVFSNKFDMNGFSI